MSSNNVTSSISSVDHSNQSEGLERNDEKLMKEANFKSNTIFKVEQSSDLSDSDLSGDAPPLTPILESRTPQLPYLRHNCKTTKNGSDDSLPKSNPQTKPSPKLFRKKSLNSAPEIRQTKLSQSLSSANPSKPGSGKQRSRKFSNYSKLHKIVFFLCSGRFREGKKLLRRCTLPLVTRFGIIAQV